MSVALETSLTSQLFIFLTMFQPRALSSTIPSAGRTLFTKEPAFLPGLQSHFQLPLPHYPVAEDMSSVTHETPVHGLRTLKGFIFSIKFIIKSISPGLFLSF